MFGNIPTPVPTSPSCKTLGKFIVLCECWFPTSEVVNIFPFLRGAVGTTLQEEDEEGSGPQPQPRDLAESHIRHFSSVWLQEQARQARVLGGSLRVQGEGGQQEWSSLAAGTPRPTQVLGNSRR